MNTRILALPWLVLSLVACSSEPEAAAKKALSASPPKVETSTSTKVESPHSPTTETSASTKTPAAASPETPAGSGPLVFSAQPGWTVEKPTSSMRKAQYVLPRAEKDTEDASLVVFYFSAQAGTPQANIDRWAQQFEQPDGRESSAAIVNAMRTVNGMSVHDVDLSGTYVAETVPGSGQRLRKEGWRMLASIVEAKEGPYYAKLVGPAATVKHWEPSFRNFVSEMKPGK